MNTTEPSSLFSEDVLPQPKIRVPYRRRRSRRTVDSFVPNLIDEMRKAMRAILAKQPQVMGNGAFGL